MILMLCRVSKGTNVWLSKRVIFGKDGYSAMQRCTSYPMAACAAIIGSGALDDKVCLSYKDIPHKEFTEKLEILF